jgi:hypothetical protein
MAGVDCKGMCDVADMSLAPPLPSPAAITAASACLTTPGVACACPLQARWLHDICVGRYGIIISLALSPIRATGPRHACWSRGQLS